MTSGVLCCYQGTLMAALEALSVAVEKGAFVPWHPPQSQSTGANIYFGPTPKAKAGPMDPLGRNLRSILCQAPWPRGTDQGPRDK